MKHAMIFHNVINAIPLRGYIYNAIDKVMKTDMVFIDFVYKCDRNVFLYMWKQVSIHLLYICWCLHAETLRRHLPTCFGGRCWGKHL